jgi:hypothetical protein
MKLELGYYLLLLSDHEVFSPPLTLLLLVCDLPLVDRER